MHAMHDLTNNSKKYPVTFVSYLVKTRLKYKHASEKLF